MNTLEWRLPLVIGLFLYLILCFFYAPLPLIGLGRALFFPFFYLGAKVQDLDFVLAHPYGAQAPTLVPFLFKLLPTVISLRVFSYFLHFCHTLMLVLVLRQLGRAKGAILSAVFFLLFPLNFLIINSPEHLPFLLSLSFCFICTIMFIKHLEEQKTSWLFLAFFFYFIAMKWIGLYAAVLLFVFPLIAKLKGKNQLNFYLMVKLIPFAMMILAVKPAYFPLQAQHHETWQEQLVEASSPLGRTLIMRELPAPQTTQDLQLYYQQNAANSWPNENFSLPFFLKFQYMEYFKDTLTAPFFTAFSHTSHFSFFFVLAILSYFFSLFLLPLFLTFLQRVNLPAPLQLLGLLLPFLLLHLAFFSSLKEEEKLNHHVSTLARYTWPWPISQERLHFSSAVSLFEHHHPARALTTINKLIENNQSSIDFRYARFLLTQALRESLQADAVATAP